MDLLQREGDQELEEGAGRERRELKRMKVCCVHTQAHHKQHDYYVLPTRANENRNWKMHTYRKVRVQCYNEYAEIHPHSRCSHLTVIFVDTHGLRGRAQAASSPHRSHSLPPTPPSFSCLRGVRVERGLWYHP